ncbi:arrestin domain-containing protein 3 [Aplysia californica]|uniref:Arrestin domain-containing protein 3 n=1 Tax=Aplysia californica TaxID=6500 RepID=A0ABM0JTI8_APLCA|nr:arrestin domain-containing protein 3 [Aplysia californica]
MKLNVFQIVLTNSDAVYFSGQVLQGHVILELTKNTKVSDIRMSFRGKAFVHWTEQAMRGPGESRYKEIRHHSATEEYIDVSKHLLSRGSTSSSTNNESRILEAGQYTYPFQFHIPPTSPSSFEGQYGFVRYWVKVAIERPWKEDVSVKKLFSVVCPVDLNREPSADQPTHNEKEKKMCCLCCISGPISASLRLNKKGYVPGETVFIQGDVNNLSSRKIGSTSVELLMTTTFHTPIKSRTVTHQVAKLHHGSIPSGGSDAWEGDRLVLPPLPPSYMIGCNVMDVRYTLELRAYPVGPAFVLTVPVEILIGTVPLNSTLERYLSAHQMTPPTPRQHGSKRGGASALAENQNRPPQYIPPTFSPSPMCHFHLHDDEDDQRTSMEGSYAPAYITFNFEVLQPRRQQTVRFAT